MPLLKKGKVAEDVFVRVREDDELPDEGGVIVGLSRWQAERNELIKRAGGVGVELAAGESPSEIADDLEHLDIVALDFPAFGDGRAFSSARILRDRHGFKGEIRAVGDVELEQLHFMSRVGFDSFLINSDDPEQDWATAQADLDLWYQPAEDGHATVRERRRS
ncbi:MAG: DUF934 domain-containing protein [Myxococcota bacterium]|nr:DUF934 domain-containing protein [Myxococcota bacterium]